MAEERQRANIHLAKKSNLCPARSIWDSTTATPNWSNYQPFGITTGISIGKRRDWGLFCGIEAHCATGWHSRSRCFANLLWALFCVSILDILAGFRLPNDMDLLDWCRSLFCPQRIFDRSGIVPNKRNRKPLAFPIQPFLLYSALNAQDCV